MEHPLARRRRVRCGALLWIDVARRRPTGRPMPDLCLLIICGRTRGQERRLRLPQLDDVRGGRGAERPRRCACEVLVRCGLRKKGEALSNSLSTKPFGQDLDDE